MHFSFSLILNHTVRTFLLLAFLFQGGFGTADVIASGSNLALTSATNSGEFTSWWWPFETTSEEKRAGFFPPFVCDGFYLTHTNGTGFFGTYNFDGTVTNFGSVGAGTNATGYNSVDNFLYTIRGNDEHILRLHSDGTIDDLGNPGLPNNLVVGAFDAAGNYYLKTGDMAEILIVNVNTLTITTLAPATVFFAKDWAYDEVRQKFYGVHSTDLYTYDPATNVVSIDPLTGFPVGAGDGNVYGAAFYSADGFTYVANNLTGNIYRINVDFLEAHFVLTATAYTGTDGASCTAALPPFPVVCAFRDTTCVPATGSVTFPILDNDLTNLTGLDFGSFSVLSAPTSGSASYNPATGEITYSFSGAPTVDQMTYQICGTSAAPVVCDYATIHFEPADPVTFNSYGPYCEGETADNLPSTSTEGVPGSWSPATISTATTGMTTYTFNPDPGVDCVAPVMIDVTVDPTVNPTFNLIDTYCEGATVESLPSTSDNGINGTWSPASIDNINSGTYTFTPAGSICSNPFTLNVIITPPATSFFTLRDTYCAGDVVENLQDVDENGVSGTWSPATIDDQNSGSYVFTPNAGECATTFTLNVTITPSGPSVFSLQNNYCAGATVDNLQDVDDNGVPGTWSPATIDNQNSGSYVFTPDAGQCASNFTLNVNIDPLTAPSFTLTSTYCEGDTPDALNSTSDNGITGNWSPSSIDNQNSGMYTFTPDAGQCASPFNLNVNIDPETTPTFNLTTTYCQGVTPDALPATSENGITGTWSPVAIDNQASGSYVFTPNNSFCAAPFTLNVVVTPNVATAFTIETTYCQDDDINPLPVVDNNGVTGSWSPASVDNQNSGMYTFTPDAGQCASPFNLDVTIDPLQTPAFTLSNNYCEGETTDALVTTSDNGITGSWSPTTIDNQNSGMYTFTPDAGQCATPFNLNVTIDPELTPAFSLVSTYCQGDTPDVLPATSDNGIAGTWLPAVIDNQNNGFYTFTADDGICATTYTLNVTITPGVTTSFTLADDYCQGDMTDPLPTTDDNGISGSWSTTSIDNQVSGTYVFTPVAGSCAAPFNLDVTISAPAIPTFTLTENYCRGASTESLPTVSNNGISGSWLPATIDNQNSGSYVFTPEATACALPFTLNVTVEAPVATVFNLPDAYCQGENVATLESQDNNGIIGTWSPAIIDNQNSGSYVFTPAMTECALPFQLDVNIEPNVASNFILRDNYCQGETVEPLPIADENGVNGSWSPATIDNQNSGSYVFTPNAGQCVSPFTLAVNIDAPILPTFSLTTTYCRDEAVESLPSISDNGVDGIWLPATIDNQNSGAYTFTPNTGSCASPFTLNVTINEPANPVFSLATEFCQGETVPTLLPADDNGIAGSWSPATIDNQVSGVYVFTPDNGVCATPFTLNITINPRVTVVFDLPASFCQGMNTTTLTNLDDNGISGSWAPAIINDQQTTLYTFTPTSGQCATVFTHEIIVNESPVLDLNVNAAILCHGSGAGSLNLDLTGIGGYQFDWSDPTLNGQQNPENLTADTYTVTVTDGNGCSASATQIIAEPDTITLAYSNTQEPTVPLATDGSTTITLAGGTPNYTVEWTGPQSGILSGTGPDFQLDNLGAGTYTVTVTDANGCIIESTFMLNNASCDLELQLSGIDPDCQTSTNGSLNLTITGTLPAQTIDWNLDALDGTEDPINLGPGAYSVTVTDAAGCGDQASFTLSAPAPVATSFNLTTVYCQGDTQETLATTDENGISGSWLPAVIDNQASGTYVFTPDADECALPYTLEVEVTLGQTPSFTLTNAYCQGENVENLPTTDATGLTGSWLPAQVDNQTSGSYVFTPTPGQCAGQFTFAVTINEPQMARFDLTTAYCSGSQAEVLPTTDLDGVTGSWSPTQIDNQASGTYTFTPDAGQCISPIVHQVTINPLPEPSLAITNAISCFGANNGALELTVSGSNNFSVIWNDATLGDNLTPSNLPPGIYVATVTTAEGCVAEATISIPEPAALALDCSQITEPNAPLFADGGVNLQLAGGTAPYTVTYNGLVSGTETVNGSSLQIDDLPGGSYRVTMTDAQGCTSACSFTLSEGCTLNAQVNGVSSDCNGLNGSIIIDTIVGGDGFYEYSLDGMTFSLVGTFPFLIPVSANQNYSLFLQDGDACLSEQTVLVPATAELALELGEDQQIRLGDSVQLRPQFNFLPVGWAWSNAEFFSQPDSLFTYVTPLETTVIRLEMQDENGCLVTDDLRISVDRREQIFVPNAFSPNGDGINDNFTIFAGNNIERITSLQIFDRWGDAIMVVSDIAPNDPRGGWNGNFRGMPANAGVYVYAIAARRIDGEEILLKGDVTLIR